ncbi:MULTISPECIES: hypothetical protein [Chryseobacterium]|uniref:Cthe-2314-like HEPN domain-containing protein n=1 Tax=Chryseobacterium aquaticum subsp. greenlandense TaxID=345663 RepID=A0A101CHJ1_9FLAO|nr:MULTISPECIES: hypothetical protein [Chryseobacterium]KNB61180.1 hypothetical protein AC804_11385 [Chryseobacterium sp. Hurlbut01]KUJ56377.1 hypothetical protein AR686_07385 [Chryseobacterium aquaticum subsp. greenlandense]
MEFDEKIELVSKLLDFASSNNNHGDLEDIRNITIDAIASSIQNYLIALKLSTHLNDISYLQKNIWEGFSQEDLVPVDFNFNGFIKDAFYNALFIIIETNFRAVAKHFEARVDTINKTSIKATFENLLSMITFFTSVTTYERDVMFYFFYLRNTMHNFGIHTKTNHSLEIDDKASLIDQSKVKLELIQDQPNNITAKEQLLLIEQVIKVIIRFNSLIPIAERIKHPLADFDYNV